MTRALALSEAYALCARRLPKSQANAVAEAEGTITARPPEAETVSRVAPGRTGDGVAEAGAAHSTTSDAGSQADEAAGGVTVGRDESGTAAHLIRGLALLPLLTLTACTIEPKAAREALRDEGYEHVEISAEPAFGRPCGWSEPYAAHFVGTLRDGERIAGTLCAVSEGAHDARVRGWSVVASRAPAWDAFGGGR